MVDVAESPLPPLRVTEQRRVSPDPGGTFVALSRIGYTLEESIADLIDNSIDAEARSVSIRLIRDATSLVSIVIADDGVGISPQRLDNAMKFAGAVRHKPGDLGKFNIGLKTASFSFGNSVSVLTKHSSGFAGRRWTVRGVREGWLLDVIDPASARAVFSRDWGLGPQKSGAVVILEDLPPERRAINRVEEFLSDFIKVAQVHLGLHFHRFLSAGRLSIWLSAESVEGDAGPPRPVNALDPFAYPVSGKRNYPKRFTAKIEGVGPLRIIAHIWPRKSGTPEYKLGGKVAQRQGLYFYRANRLIQAGGWNGWLGDGEPHLSLARARIDLPERYDEAFGLNVQKTRIIAPPTFIEALTEARSREVTFADYVRDAQEVYRKRPAEPEPSRPMPGRGISSPVRRALRGDSRGRGTRVRFAWRSLDPAEFFRLERENSTVLLNARLRRTLQGHPAQSFAKVALFLLLEPYFERERLREDDRSWLLRANEAFTTALGAPTRE